VSELPNKAHSWKQNQVNEWLWGSDGRNRPIHISTSSKCIEQGAVDVLDSRFQVALDDTVELKRLPGGDFERPIPVLVRDLIHQEPLLGVTNAGGHSDTNHERVGRFDTLGLTLISDVTIVLLVDSVELGELSIGSGRVHQWCCPRDPERWSLEDTGRRL
jgi:hypothetical protein